MFYLNTSVILDISSIIMFEWEILKYLNPSFNGLDDV